MQFKIGSILFMESVLIIQTLIRYIKFHIVKANILFLFSLVDINWLDIYFNNIDNLLVIKSTHILVIYHINHLFFLWKSSLGSFITQSFHQNPYYLTKMKLRQFSRCFGHFFTMKLCLLLEWSKYEVYKPALYWLI